MVASSFLKVPLTRMKTLDYGMGWGLWVRIAKKLGCDSYGVEVSQEHLDYIRGHGCGGITDAEIPEHRFHFINTEQVFEHVPQPLQLLKLLAGSLEPGGVVKISVPSGEKADRIVAALKDGTFGGDYETIMPVHPLEHINTFTRGTIREMAGLAGLKLVKPNLIQSYAFLGHKGAVSLKRAKKSAKELVRPIYQWIQPSNIYVWLRKS
jgi:SAM-dependent methyltransferase